MQVGARKPGSESPKIDNKQSKKSGHSRNQKVRHAMRGGVFAFGVVWELGSALLHLLAAVTAPGLWLHS